MSDIANDMEKNDKEDDYKTSMIWGLIFVVMFFVLILFSIWAVKTGNYNTP